MSDGSCDHEVSVQTLGEGLRELRLCESSALEAVQRSLIRHGQLEAVVAYAEDERLELIDGFKRLLAARKLGWRTLRTRVLGIDGVEAKLRVALLNARNGLTALEEGWLVRALCRAHGLSQGAIAERLGRHKSWVCRRLVLVEGLEGAVQADVRLGVLAARAAVALAALPRGNQARAAEVVARRGMTVRQAERLVADVLAQPSAQARLDQLGRWEAGTVGSSSARRPTKRLRSEAERLLADVGAMRGIGARLQARLLGTPLSALGDGAELLARDGLRGLRSVLVSLTRLIEHVVERREDGGSDA